MADVIHAGQKRPFTVVLKDAHGNPPTVPLNDPVKLTSSDTSVMEVKNLSADGLSGEAWYVSPGLAILTDEAGPLDHFTSDTHEFIMVDPAQEAASSEIVVGAEVPQ